MAKAKKGYQYIIADSILGNTPDEYSLSENEYFCIYSFFVTYSMCGRQSAKKRTFVDYGWGNDGIKDSQLGDSLKSLINLNRNSDFVFTDKDKLLNEFSLHQLTDGQLLNVNIERAVIVRNSEPNNYLQLFYRIRDGFAHGKFKLRFSETMEKMVVIQDDDGHNVTARIVLRLSTIMRFIKIIDINSIICRNRNV